MKNLIVLTPALLTLFLAPACEPVETDDDATADTDDGAKSDDAGEQVGGGSPEARLCERAQECGYMEAGYTVGDCTDIVQSCTDDLLTSAKADWDMWAEDCLGLNNCMNFGACYLSIDVCTLEVEVADDSDTPDDPSGADAGSGSCVEGDSACVDDNAIAVCVEGEVYQAGCDELCVEAGWSYSVGCGFDGESGQDVCFCE